MRRAGSKILKKSFIFAFIITFGVLANLWYGISFQPLKPRKEGSEFANRVGERGFLSVYAASPEKVVQLKTLLKVDEISEDNIVLPKPRLKSNFSVEEAISRRRSRRLYKKEPINLEQLSQILWAAQGITGEAGDYKLRAAPSAGALYPMEIYIVLPRGVYHYLPEKHSLEKIKDGDLRADLSKAALDQQWIEETSADIVITAVYERIMVKYGERGIRYAVSEAGGVSENIYLQAESLGLGTVSVGAFRGRKVQEVLGLPKDRHPLLIMPLGYPASENKQDREN